MYRDVIYADADIDDSLSSSSSDGDGGGIGVDDALRSAIAMRMLEPLDNGLGRDVDRVLPRDDECREDCYRDVHGGHRDDDRYHHRIAWSSIPYWETSTTTTAAATATMFPTRDAPPDRWDHAATLTAINPTEMVKYASPLHAAIHDNGGAGDHRPIDDGDAVFARLDDGEYGGGGGGEVEMIGPGIDTTSSPTTVGKRRGVTFGTKDSVHTYDERCEVLRNVDGEFFDVARRIMDVENDAEARLQRRGRRGGGSGSILSALFCGIGGEGGGGEDETASRVDGNDEIVDENGWPTKGLVADFLSALKYRMENLGSSSREGDDDVAARTKEIARRINAYGLPMTGLTTVTSTTTKMPLMAMPMEDGGGGGDSDSNGVAFTYEGVNSRIPRPFPVLPVDDDDENDQGLANRASKCHTSHDSKGSSSWKSNITSPFSLGSASIFASLLGPKSATPTVEECKTTMVDSVRVACEERLRQLISELNSLRASGEDDAWARDATGGVSDREEKGEEDGEWYDRVLMYVGGAEMTKDRLRGNPDGRAPHYDGEHHLIDGGRANGRPAAYTVTKKTSYI
ncbi:hypothetical protein ACHAXA_003745 [Cyclostephanos tholiformis]|uniref:Uncharacterized protein n=1 Tax=Cyclostephanos tholiformis TaxID=382380 RepID=A0ABD3SSU7_9STRA